MVETLGSMSALKPAYTCVSVGVWLRHAVAPILGVIQRESDVSICG